MTVHKIKLSELTLDPHNVKRHAARDINAIAASLEKFGQVTPIVFKAAGDLKIIVKGNGTYLAAKQLAWESINAVETQLDGEKLDAYALADNHTATLSQWDIAKLEEQVRGFDQDLQSSLGFDTDELSQLLSHYTPMPSGKLSLTIPDSRDSYSVRIDGILDADKQAILDAVTAKLKTAELPYTAQAH